MNAQAILQKIEDDAKQTAVQIVEDAQAKTEQMNNESRKKLQSMRDEMASQADKESKALSERMERMAELDMRKELLAKKRDVMQSAFVEAKELLCAMDASEMRNFLLGQIVKSAMGDEQLIVGADHSDWYQESFVSDVNQTLAGQGKQASLVVSADRREGVTGAILGRKGTEVYCTVEAMLETIRAEMETEVARILFEN